ncbi:hypothetical protein G7Y89_g6164 [Cudoniella acicularis]|uniref:Heterokaryon incompatibility domain-containing protein n=1 Tax=Cudoniella acicularis TaxID=354080 RepID=A0A8H4W509_9HELO|nr:hypothetical protein G7Y89_g6164 [Cudoniella acicularis]
MREEEMNVSVPGGVQCEVGDTRAHGAEENGRYYSHTLPTRVDSQAERIKHDPTNNICNQDDEAELNGDFEETCATKIVDPSKNDDAVKQERRGIEQVLSVQRNKELFTARLEPILTANISDPLTDKTTPSAVKDESQDGEHCKYSSTNYCNRILTIDGLVLSQCAINHRSIEMAFGAGSQRNYSGLVPNTSHPSYMGDNFGRLQEIDDTRKGGENKGKALPPAQRVPGSAALGRVTNYHFFRSPINEVGRDPYQNLYEDNGNKQDRGEENGVAGIAPAIEDRSFDPQLKIGRLYFCAQNYLVLTLLSENPHSLERDDDRTGKEGTTLNTGVDIASIAETLPLPNADAQETWEGVWRRELFSQVPEGKPLEGPKSPMECVDQAIQEVGTDLATAPDTPMAFRRKMIITKSWEIAGIDPRPSEEEWWQSQFRYEYRGGSNLRYFAESRYSTSREAAVERTRLEIERHVDEMFSNNSFLGLNVSRKDLSILERANRKVFASKVGRDNEPAFESGPSLIDASASEAGVASDGDRLKRRKVERALALGGLAFYEGIFPQRHRFQRFKSEDTDVDPKISKLGKVEKFDRLEIKEKDELRFVRGKLESDEKTLLEPNHNDQEEKIQSEREAKAEILACDQEYVPTTNGNKESGDDIDDPIEKLLPSAQEQSWKKDSQGEDIPKIYKRLPYADSIRLLRLEPAKLEDRYNLISCSLQHVRLHELSEPYEALSYTWGDAKDQQFDISCNGVTMTVRRNLLWALQRLRLNDKVRTIWIDALCIDQTNDIERTQQVRLMRLIYRNANSVVIWLGTDRAGQARLAFSVLSSIVSRWLEDNKITLSTDYTIGNESFKARPLINPPTQDSPLWNAVVRIFNASWFWRMWVVQEVVLARSATLIWGKGEISWRIIGLAASIIRTNSHYLGRRSSMKGVYNAYLMYRLSASQDATNPNFSVSFLDLLRLTRQFEVSDERDRIYGILGLTTTDNDPENGSLFIDPDYNIKANEVYLRVANRIVQSSNSLDLLSSVQHGFGNPLNEPSWVPHWHSIFSSTLAPWDLHETISTAKSFPRQLQPSPNPNLLVTSAIPISRISYYSSNMQQTIDVAVSEILATPEIASHLETEEGIRLWCKTMTAGRNWYGSLDTSTSAKTSASTNVADFTAYLLQYHSSSLTDPLFNNCKRLSGKEGSTGRFLETAGTVCSERRLFISDNGFVGLGPAHLEVGDGLFVLSGANMPFILRGEGGEGSGGVGSSHVYRLIGEAFVEGIMGGEAVEAAKKGRVIEGPVVTGVNDVKDDEVNGDKGLECVWVELR